MRIGILTFHGAHNYGAILQCYALQEYCRSLGHEVEVINHIIPQMASIYEPMPRQRIKQALHNPLLAAKILIKGLLQYRKRKARYDAFNGFIGEKLRIVSVNTINTNPYNVIFVGSDQVWNTEITCGYDSYYWGTFKRPSKTKLVSYAASMYDVWPECENEKVACLLKNFNMISVREDKVLERIHEIAPNLNPIKVVDPAWLLSKEQWKEIAGKDKISKSYLLLFQVEPLKKAELVAQELAQKNNLEIVYLSATADRINSPSVVASSPSDFISLFMNASFIVCTSFHGTVFSLIFDKPFKFVGTGTSRDARVRNLLDNIDNNKETILLSKQYIEKAILG